MQTHFITYLMNHNAKTSFTDPKHENLFYNLFYKSTVRELLLFE